MLFTRQLLWSALASIAVVGLGDAQSTPGTQTITTTSSTSTAKSTGKATHTIQVGPKTSPHAYVPHSITANVGDVVVFEFYPTNHSVVQADYDAPCVPGRQPYFHSKNYNDFNTNGGELVGPAPTWSLVVNNTEPTFFYCTAIDSCIKNGMVGVINPNSSQTFKTQYDKALDSPYMLVPGQSPPAEGSDGSDSGSSSSSSSDSGGGHGLSKGAIAGIAVAGVVFVGILVALFFLLGRNRVYKQWMSSQDGRTERTARWALFNHPNGGPEVASNAGKPPMTDTTSVSSPDPGRYNTMSPPLGDGNSSYGPSSPRQQSGHWSWDPSFNQRNARGPSELEASHIIHQLPESSNER